RPRKTRPQKSEFKPSLDHAHRKIGFSSIDRSTPWIRTILFLEPWPERISTDLRGAFNARARTLINSAFAAPSTGGKARRTRKAPSCSPTISLREARGDTRTVKVIAPSFSE